MGALSVWPSTTRSLPAFLRMGDTLSSRAVPCAVTSASPEANSRALVT